MKPSGSIVNWLVKISVLQRLVLFVLILLGGGYSAESQDFKTFDAQESYVSEGTSIVLTQKVGQATAKLFAPSPGAQSRSALTTTSGANFSRIVELPRGLVIYDVQTSAGRALSTAENVAAISSLNSDATVAYAFPVYVNPNTGNRVFLNDEIVVRLRTASALQDTNLAPPFKLRLAETLSAADNIYVFRLTDPKNFNPFRICNALRALPGVVWAEPNFAQEANQFVIPNDTLFSTQWPLRNTGQTGGTSDADVDADDAWGGSQGYGSPGIRIAIIDDGVQTTHPDLSANIVQGYDWYSGDSDPNPDGIYNNHGTAVAGLAAAAVNNSLGVAGVAGKSQILPVRLLNTYDSDGHAYLPDSTTVYRAIVYAADNADIINCSWGGLSPNYTITSGFVYASAYGRNGYGCLVFCASGNSAGGSGPNSYSTLWGLNLYSTFGAGNYFIAFLYAKNESGSANDDCFWLADITMPNGSKQRLDSPTLPAGWSTSGNANWTTSIDPAHAHGTGRYAWRSGAIGDNQVSYLLTPLTTVSSSQNTITFRSWISSAPLDQEQLYVLNSLGQTIGIFDIGEGPVANRITAVTYPANLSSVFAVGATSDFDYRSHFSQYDSTLDFVAPGAGGYGGIATTDRTGTDGYSSSDYNTGFSGTSASSPIAAGVAALALSKDGKQSASTLATKLKSTCDKVGPVAYAGTPYTRNDYYGFGRLNANSAIGAVTADTTAPTFTSAMVMHYRAVDVVFSEPMGDGALTPGNYTITAGADTLASNPAKVIRIMPTVYRLIWNSGDMATSGTVTIAASSAIKDVAGNALTGTLSRSSTGTKRVIGVNSGGNRSSYFGVGNYIAPPFVTDNGFQGNEPNPLLTFTSEMSEYYLFHISIDTSGVTDPAPQAVYQTTRVVYYSDQVITYKIPVSSGSYKVRMHFSQNYMNSIGEEVFHIYVNGNLVSSWFDILAQTGGQKYKAYIAEFNNIPPVNGAITVTLDGEPGSYEGESFASICGIEVVKP